MADIDQKQYIERAIVRARDGVGDRIDELDRHLRTNLDPTTLAKTYAPHLIAGGAVVGLIVGFGLPKVFRKLVTWGVPIGIIAMTIKNARDRDELVGLS
ncbi:MAG TPA: hypothetical protein VEK11_16340 [Thermoanaerobaculia bacterium]|jgi:hypothetical protein|nr:hypothetical protein [Thermoanaerobaculia bacterium]